MHQLLPANTDDRSITALAPLATGDLLLGTRAHGVLLYNGTTLKPVRFSLRGIDAGTLQVTALTAIDAATFLVGTRNLGVFYVHAGTVDHADASSGLPDDQVESIAVGPGMTPHVFVGTPLGTADFDLAASSFRPSRIVGKGLFSHALAVGRNALMVGTLDEGVRQVMLDARPTFRHISVSADDVPAASLERVDAFFKGPDALYALVDGNLMRNQGTAWAPALPPPPTGLTDRNISALAFAPDGTLYVGFFDRGLDLMNADGAVRHLEDDHLFCINRLVLDPERHTVVAGTANGLVLFDAQGNPRQTLTRHDGLIADHVNDIAYTNQGAVVATSAGITFLGASGAESLYAFQGLVNNHVYALAAHRESDRVLAGTLGGISELKSASVVRSLTATNSTLKHNWVTALLPLQDSTVLVGTYGRGIQGLDVHGNFSPIDLPAGAPRDLVISPNSLFATPAHIFAGTLAHGLLVYSMRTGRWSMVSAGLPSLNVTAFAARDGEVYVGTDNGLVRIAEASLP